MRTNHSIEKYALTALLSALCYIAFTLIKITIPVANGATAIHFGNCFCLLAALVVGGPLGGVAGAIGMGIADIMDPLYIIYAPKTLILKFIMGLICGCIAHKGLKLSDHAHDKTISFRYALISCGIAAGCNVILDPLFSLLYNHFVFGATIDTAALLASFDLIASLINAIISSIAAALIYTGVCFQFNYNRLK